MHPSLHHGVRPTLTCGKSRTKQSFKADCDINNIIRRFDKTGVLTHLNQRQPLYIDASEVMSYRDALNHVIQVEEHFEDLPSAVRAEFDNDPAAYLDWVVHSTPEERSALIMGTPAPSTPAPAPAEPEDVPTPSEP